ncbi:hypothetical protein R1flu_012409 [Riccia fluitans]|uniref:Uncharacterized protein n=1 Tax=Riccia fluitans TaxID=41844 RepID=A0ABD1ZEN8_9MARC
MQDESTAGSTFMAGRGAAAEQRPTPCLVNTKVPDCPAPIAHPRAGFPLPLGGIPGPAIPRRFACSNSPPPLHPTEGKRKPRSGWYPALHIRSGTLTEGQTGQSPPPARSLRVRATLATWTGPREGTPSLPDLGSAAIVTPSPLRTGIPYSSHVGEPRIYLEWDYPVWVRRQATMAAYAVTSRDLGP